MKKKRISNLKANAGRGDVPGEQPPRRAGPAPEHLGMFPLYYYYCCYYYFYYYYYYFLFYYTLICY